MLAPSRIGRASRGSRSLVARLNVCSVLFATIGAVAPAFAQSDPAIPTANAAVRAALDRIPAINAWILDRQVALCEIPAPPFKEAARARSYQRALIDIGYPNTRIDSIGDVIAELRGGDGPTIMIAGHLDTVFPEGTSVAVDRSGTRLDGPGIGDDCRGLAVVLAVARVIKERNVVPRGRIVFVGDVGEEGAGNSRGVHWLLEREFKGEVAAFISVDGPGNTMTTRAVGSHRYTVTVSGPGGHSYADFGMPNPAHALGRAIARISDLQVPEIPRTTFSVGGLRGGTSVNSIPMQAQMDIDMRSESADALADLDTRVHAAVDSAIADEQRRWPNSNVRLNVKYDTIGIRPTGSQSESAPIVRAAIAAARTLGFTPRTVASSTDSNVPISMGIPAITIDGGGRGDGEHSTSEWYEDGAEGWKGPQWALLIVAAMVGVR